MSCYSHNSVANKSKRFAVGILAKDVDHFFQMVDVPIPVEYALLGKFSFDSAGSKQL